LKASLRTPGLRCTFRCETLVLCLALASAGCASSVDPSDGSGLPRDGATTDRGVGLPDGTSTLDGSTGFDAVLSGDSTTGVDVSVGPGRCPIVGTYRTNGGTVMTIVLSADGAYSADGGRFRGSYAWDGTTLSFTPGPGSTSNECPSQSGSRVRVTFDATCGQALVVTTEDGCTGGGLLTRSSNLTRQ